MLERIRLTETGWSAPLVCERLDEAPPTPTGDQVLVEVEACGICHRDLLDREGRFPFIAIPVTPGHEAAGRVVAIGSEVTDWKIGDRVGTMQRDACGQCPQCLEGQTSLCLSAAHALGILADGGYASHLLLPQSGLFALPDDLEAAEAAVLQCTFGTAYRDLKTLGHIRAGERVLITGANGGVGSAGIQIARALGAEVVAVIRSEAHAAFLRTLGDFEIIVDPGDSFHRHPALGRIDLALDTVGCSTFNATLRSLRIGGRAVIVGNIVNERFSLNLGYLITQGLTITGGSGATRGDMAELLELHRRHRFVIPIDRRLPLAHAEQGQRLVRAGGLHGRIALVPSG